MAASRGVVSYWIANKIPFSPFDNHPLHDKILSAMNEIENNSAIWFAKRGDEPNYIEFTQDDNKKNGADSIGMSPGLNLINITPKSNGWWALHELCHVVGLIHEQARSDSQTYLQTCFRTDVDILLGCTTIPANPNGVVDPQDHDMKIDCDSLNLTEFDRLSVMLYAKDMGLISGSSAPSMEWRADPSLDLGAADRQKLSDLDIQGIQALCATNLTGWSPQASIDGVGTQTTPALAEYQGQLYAVWNGYHNDGIFYATFDGQAWSWQSQIGKVGTENSPAVAVFNGQLYAAWNGYRDDGIFYSAFDGQTWSPETRLAGVGTRLAPALAAYGGKLYAAWNGFNNDGIFYATFDGQTWSPQAKLEDAATQNAPTLAVCNGQLYAAWNGYHDDGIFYATFDGQSWSPQARVSTYGTTASPALAAFGNPYTAYDANDPNRAALFLTWKGAGDNYIWWATFSPQVNAWSAQARTKFATSTGSALAKFNDRLYLAWCEVGKDGIFWSAFRCPT